MVVILVAHGSPDPRSAAALRALAAAAQARVEQVVHLAFLDHDAPALADLDLGGAQHAVVIPMLLTSGYHDAVDIPDSVARLRATCGLTIEITPMIGMDARFADAVDLQLPPGPVVLVHAPTRDPGIASTVGDVSLRLQRLREAPVAIATPASLPEVLDEIEAAGRAAIGLLMLADGRLADQVRGAAGGRTMSAPLAATPLLVDIVCERIRAHVLQAAS